MTRILDDAQGNLEKTRVERNMLVVGFTLVGGNLMKGQITHARIPRCTKAYSTSRGIKYQAPSGGCTAFGVTKILLEY